MSWCDFVIGYGPWIDPAAARDQPFLAGHNSSYRREVLLALGDRLAEALEAETVLHMELRSQGKRLVRRAPRPRGAHQFRPPRRVGPGAVPLRTGLRGRARPALGLAQAALLRGGIAADSLRPLRARDAPAPPVSGADALPCSASLPLLALGLGADGVGQMIGYVAGGGGSARQLTAFEFRRVDFVPESDRHLWQEAGTRA